MTVKLPFSIHSASIFLSVYFWHSYFRGEESMWGRGRGRGIASVWQLGRGDGWWGTGSVSVWSVEDETVQLCSVGSSLIFQ